MTLAEVDSGTRDRATTEWNGQRYEARSRHGATMKLARSLVEASCPDMPWRAMGGDGRVRFYGPSLRALAGWTVQETDGGGLRLKPFTRLPGSVVEGVLEVAR